MHHNDAAHRPNSLALAGLHTHTVTALPAGRIGRADISKMRAAAIRGNGSWRRTKLLNAVNSQAELDCHLEEDLTGSGRWLLPDDPRYHQALFGHSWNKRQSGARPQAILLATCSEDVVAGVKLARARNWQVSVRSGGHSWAHWGVRDNALLIDLAGLNQIELLADNIVRVGPAVRGGADLAPFLQQRGLMFSVGHCSGVGLGGFLLQGGMGWNTRGYGWAAEHIESIDIVTAQGELVRADARTNRDLFWAARGSGPGFFGVVTAFHLRARPMPCMAETTIILPVGLTAEAMRWILSVHGEMAMSTEFIVNVGRLPLPPHLDPDAPVFMAHAIAFERDPDAARAVLAPLHDCPLLDHAILTSFDQPTALTTELASVEVIYPEGCRYAVDNFWADDEGDMFVDVFAGIATSLPSRGSSLLWSSQRPKPPISDMAFSMQGNSYVAVYAAWEDEADDTCCREWLAHHMRRAEPITVGQYLGDSDFSTRHVRFMHPDNLARLEEIRQQRDPHGTFASYRVGAPGQLNVNGWAPARLTQD